MLSWTEDNRPQRSIKTIASFNQWSKTIKTIESDGRKTKNHWKTIYDNGQTAKKHSLVMVASKTIENFQ